MFLVLDLSLLFVSEYYLQTSYLLLVDLLTAMPCSMLCFLYLNKCSILHLGVLFL